jgi:ATP-dependent Clp protease ATP-binding subunit ClpA
MDPMQLSKRAQRLLFFAHEEAKKGEAMCISSAHLFLGALALGGYISSAFVSGAANSPDVFCSAVSKTKARATPHGYTESTIAVLRSALAIAHSFGHRQVDAAHIALALVREEQGEASQLMDSLGVRRRAVELKLIRRLSARKRRA